MSILDKGRSVDVEGALKEITEVIKSFYTDDNLDQKTELSEYQIMHLTKLEYVDDLMLKEFGYKSEMTDKIKNRIERKYVSYKRTGRVEGMQTLSAQLSQILMHPQTALRRMFGVD